MKFNENKYNQNIGKYCLKKYRKSVDITDKIGYNIKDYCSKSSEMCDK